MYRLAVLISLFNVKVTKKKNNFCAENKSIVVVLGVVLLKAFDKMHSCLPFVRGKESCSQNKKYKNKAGSARTFLSTEKQKQKHQP